MSLAEMKNREFFRRLNFTPRTQIGRFDAACAPARGEIIIETCLYLNFSDMQDNDRLAFQQQFAQLVPQTWNDVYKFRCVKDNFENIEIKPKFRLRYEAEFKDSHYVVNVKNSIFGKEKVSRQDYYQATGDYKPKVAQLGGMKSLQPLDFSEAISKDIAALFPLHIKCPITTGSISPHSKQTLQFLGRQISSLNPNLTIHLSAGGKQSTVNMGKVEQELSAAGCTHCRRHTKWFKYKNEVVLTLKEEIGDGGNNKPASLGYPATVVHEYGHMLGLADEYNCLSKIASDKLAELNFISGDEQVIYENLHFPGAAVMENEFAATQRQQIELCHLAGVAAPNFGFKSSSIMASGSDVHPGHMVTIWECLVDMTKDYTTAADWKIVRA